jgi:phosphatidyl-myo-inositol alpha-mannosyltransferase
MAKQKPSYKIGFVLDGGLEKPDGVQQYILGLGGYFKSQGHKVRYIASGKIPGHISDAVSLSKNMSVQSNGNKLNIPLPASRSKICKYLNEEMFDILHIQTPYSPMMGEQLIFMAGDKTAVIGTYHIVPISKLLSIGNKLLGLWCRTSLKRFDKMLSVSSAAKKVAKEDFGIESEILPNIVDFDRFSSAKPFNKYQDGKINILFFGRLVPRKGCKLLLEAITLLRERTDINGKVRVIVCGTGPMADDLSKYVKDNGLSGVVEFTGFVLEEDKPSYYASADISVFPSSGGESFGIVLLEALSTGRAVVLGGDNVGYRSVLESKEELLFDPFDAAELADKLEFYISNKQERSDVAAWAKGYAMDFDVKVVGDKILEAYKEALHFRNGY